MIEEKEGLIFFSFSIKDITLYEYLYLIATKSTAFLCCYVQGQLKTCAQLPLRGYTNLTSFYRGILAIY